MKDQTTDKNLKCNLASFIPGVQDPSHVLEVADVETTPETV